MESKKAFLGKVVIVTAILFCLCLSGMARAELQVNGNLVYDTITNRTWLKDANHAKTSGYHVNGTMTWAEAQTFIASLNAANYGGHNDWRLPDAKNLDGSGPNYGYTCATGHNAAYDTQNTEGGSLYWNYAISMGNTSPFVNIFGGYWTSTSAGGDLVYKVNAADKFSASTSTKGSGNPCDWMVGYVWPVRTGTP